mgnify:FL=1
MNIKELNCFLKTLKNGTDRFELIREYIARYENDDFLAEKEMDCFTRETERYFALENHLNEVLENFLSDEEREIVVSYYMHGKSAEVLILSKYISRRTFFRQLKKVKEKILENW